MIKTLSAYVNVALEDYDDSTINHVVELMKESLREQTDNILENTWKVEEFERKLVKNDEGAWEPLADRLSKVIEVGEILEVMTVGVTVDVLSNI